MTLADEVRAFVVREYIEPARAAGLEQVTLVTGDVHKRMGLVGRLPAVCSALTARAFELESDVTLEKAEGPREGASLRLTFHLAPPSGLGGRANAHAEPPPPVSGRVLAIHTSPQNPAAIQRSGAPMPDTQATGDADGPREPLDRLADLGFEKAGEWLLVASRPSFRLDRHLTARKVLYAFVSGTTVMYVGKSVRSLEQRMTGYQSPGPTQRTNIRVQASITDLLKSGAVLDIWVFVGEQMKYRGFEVSLAAGLEDAIVEALQPPWNVLGR